MKRFSGASKESVVGRRKGGENPLSGEGEDKWNSSIGKIRSGGDFGFTHEDDYDNNTVRRKEKSHHEKK